MTRSLILGTGMAVPDRIVTNDDLAAVMDTTDEWITQRTGIRQRHWVREGETGVDLAERASRRAIDGRGPRPTETSMRSCWPRRRRTTLPPATACCCSTASASGPFPRSTSARSAAGSSTRWRRRTPTSAAGLFRHVLVVGQEVQSTGMDVSTRGRATAVIFADGAGAVVLGPSAAIRRAAFSASTCTPTAPSPTSSGSMLPARCITRGSARSSSPRAGTSSRWTARRCSATRWCACPSRCARCWRAWEHRSDDVKLLLPHQANLRISEMVQKSLGLRDDQVYNNIMSYGNTTAATIPDRARRVRPRRAPQAGRPGGRHRVRIGLHVGERGAPLVAEGQGYLAA